MATFNPTGKRNDAEKLRNDIENYWSDRGYSVSVRVEKVEFAQDKQHKPKPLYCIRSNIIDVLRGRT